MKVLIDTNVIIDLIAVRDPFFRSAKSIFELCGQKKPEGYIAAHSLTNAYYILRKYRSDAERRSMLLKICEIVSVVGVDGSKVINALKRNEFPDFEDCLQDECAVECGADYIITRNVKDFSQSKVPPITAEDFIKLIDKR